MTPLWNDADRGNLKYLELYCPSSTSNATNSTTDCRGTVPGPHMAMTVDQPDINTLNIQSTQMSIRMSATFLKIFIK